MGPATSAAALPLEAGALRPEDRRRPVAHVATDAAESYKIPAGC